MNDAAATSLDRLHDLVLPPAVLWWPLAPGWYVVLGIAIVLVFVLLHRAWKRWRADAYRRAALHELDSIEDAVAMAELLRRTALAIAPRHVIAEKTGAPWLDWLAAQCPDAMPDTVCSLLTTGVYGRPPASRSCSTPAPETTPSPRDVAQAFEPAGSGDFSAFAARQSAASARRRPVASSSRAGNTGQECPVNPQTGMSALPKSPPPDEVGALRHYTSRWIAHHRVPSAPRQSRPC